MFTKICNPTVDENVASFQYYDTNYKFSIFSDI